MSIFVPHHAPATGQQISSYATYVATGAIVTGAMYVGTRSLLGYDKTYDLQAEISKYLQDRTSYDHEFERRKSSFYVIEIDDNTSYLPHLGDMAMTGHPQHLVDSAYPLNTLGDMSVKDHIGDMCMKFLEMLKPASKMVPTSPTISLLSLWWLFMGMTKTLAMSLMWNAAIGSATYLLVIAAAASAITLYHATVRLANCVNRILRVMEAMPVLIQLLLALPVNRVQRKEEVKLILSIIEGVGLEVARLRSVAIAQHALSAQLLSMLLEIHTEIDQNTTLTTSKRIELVDQLRNYNTHNQEAINTFHSTIAYLELDDLEGHLTAFFRATEFELKNVGVQLRRAATSTLPQSPRFDHKFGVPPGFASR
jgi:hypothetical protein